MLLRRLVAALGPLLLCVLVCAVFRWLDGMIGAASFLAFLLKGALLGAALALTLPLAGIRARTNGLTGWLLLGAGILAVALAVLLVVRRMPLPERLVWTLVLGGGLGNFIDRARTGVVVDYLNFQFISFPVFNFADICVCVGVGLLILLLVADMVRDSRGNRKADGPQAS